MFCSCQCRRSDIITSVYRGMYIGYLKLRTFVDAIHVVVNETCPNVLPHVKIRDNPNVSREEWQWLQSMDTLGVSKQLVRMCTHGVT